MSNMPTLTAVAHILGSAVALSVLGLLLLFIASWEAERNQKRVLQEIAVKLGVSVEALNSEIFNDKILKISSERSSNELLGNRLSDLCGLVRTLWAWLGSLLQVVALGATIWFTVTDNLDNAVYAWFALGIAIFFWVSSVVFSLLCYFLTGRYPGEAKLARKGLAQFLEEAEEEAHIAREAPEVAGMDFVKRTSYLLKAADDFSAAASTAEKEDYLDSVAKMKDLFASKGKAMPSWFHLVIIRMIEHKRASG